MNTEEKNQIAELLASAKRIAVIPSKLAGPEAYAAGVGLYYLLKNAEKNVSLIYPGKTPDEFPDIISREELTADTGRRELVVAVDYSNTPASKVQYTTENDVLYLTLSPMSKNFDFSKITSSLKGFDFDLIFVIGSQTLEDLGQTYSDMEANLKEATVVNIDNTDKNTKYGKVNLIDISKENLSLLILNTFGIWGLNLDRRAAKALLGGAMYKAGI